MFCSSYSRIFLAVFLISFLCYSCSKKSVGVASDIPDMESSDESHIAKREITSRKEKRTLKRKLKSFKDKQQLEKDNNLERKKSGRKKKGRDIKKKEKKKKMRLEKGAPSKKIPGRKTSKKKRKKITQIKK